MKHKLEDVSIVLGFNTARGDEEHLQITRTKHRKSKTRQLGLEDPEKLNQAVDKIINSKHPKGHQKNQKSMNSTGKRSSRMSEFKKSDHNSRMTPSNKKSMGFGFMAASQDQDMVQQAAEQEQTDGDNDVDEEDIKEVVIILQEQLTLKTREINDLRAYICDLKEEHSAYSDKLELEIADYKIKYA